MATDGNSLVFIDVDASTPAVKVEQEESMEQDAEDVPNDPNDTQRKESNGSDSSNIAEHKKVAFSPEERQLVISLVEQFPVLKDKRISSKYIMLKQRAWERITMAYNAQSFVARRNPVQIKRTNRVKKENRPTNRFKCKVCNYETYHQSLFKEHVNRHTGTKPFKCELCPYASVSKKYVKMHQDKHKTCLCGFLSQNRSEFKRHLKKCGKNLGSTARFICPDCKKEYVDEKALETHIAHRQVCSMCAEMLCANEVKSHMAQVHNVRRSEKKKEKFQCALCLWSSSAQQKILLHLIHHPDQPIDSFIDVTVLKKAGIL